MHRKNPDTMLKSHSAVIPGAAKNLVFDEISDSQDRRLGGSPWRVHNHLKKPTPLPPR
jgi:hypothetical protein